MELSPKQQAVEQIKKAKNVLILGHQNPSGDMVGSGIALCALLNSLEKKVDFVVTEEIPAKYSFLNLGLIKPKFDFLEGKLLRINTEKFPVKGIKYQKNEEFLDIFLDADKNLKFEFLEIKNGTDRPDLIIALDSKKLAELDTTLRQMPEVFVGVPILNIDHHSGNEYFGAVNLVDLTATSTAEILVSLIEALGSKLADADSATALLTGIIEDTESFQKSNTTPKSFTVAAQLLAAGAKQQEIIAGLFKKEADNLMLLWRNLVKNAKDDKKFALSWSTLKSNELAGASEEEVLEAAKELLGSFKETNKLLVVFEEGKGVFKGMLLGEGASELTKSLKAKEVDGAIFFEVKGDTLANSELRILKLLADFWSKTGAPSGLWDVLTKEATEEKLSTPETLAEIQEVTPEPDNLSKPETEFEREAMGVNPKTEVKERKSGFDPIENAIQSLADNQTKTKGFATLKEIMESKQREYGKGLKNSLDEEIDVFDEEE